jgi:hypothetical protein
VHSPFSDNKALVTPLQFFYVGQKVQQIVGFAKAIVTLQHVNAARRARVDPVSTPLTAIL